MKTKLLLLIALISTLSYGQTFDWETAVVQGSSQNPNSSVSQNINGQFFVGFSTPNLTPVLLTTAGQGTSGLSVRNQQNESSVNIGISNINGDGLDVQTIKVFEVNNNQDWTFKSLDDTGVTLEMTTANVSQSASIVTLNWTNVKLIEITKTNGSEANFGVDDIVFSPYMPPCTVNIPDANFKNYLVNNTAINTNGDTEIQCSEATAFTGILDVNNSSISDLTGIEAFTEITELKCNGNSLSTIDVSQNTKITLLNVASNQLTALDLSTNTLLNTLWAQVNQFSSLDLSGYTSLNLISVGSNPLLSSLNVANGNNSNISSNNFGANNNPNLTCITVDNVAYSTTNWTFIDAQTSFSTNCPPCIVNIPDVNFKNYLVNNTAINTNGDTEIQCSEASAFTGQINCPGLNISDMTGIEAFTALTDLRCQSNNLSSIDVSNNTALTLLWVQFNSLTSLDVSNNTLLENLSYGNNSLTFVNTSTNTALKELYAYANPLTNLDISNNTALELLWCNSTQRASLDISNHTSIISLQCHDNALTSLNVANGVNSSFVTFEATGNPNLTCITVDDVAYSSTTWSSLIDPQASFSANCNTSVPGVTYINHAATGNNDGTSWADAYTHLETALAAATDGDEFWVATGTYLPNTTGSQTSPFSVNNADLKIYGGFAGTETQLSHRVLGTNETILSGDFNNNDVFPDDNYVDNFNHATKTDNSHNIINITAAGNNLLLDGLTISNAHYTTNNVSGAIMKEKTVSNLTLKNCTIKNNISAAGSGLVAEFELNNASSGTPGTFTIENCIFKNNMSRFGSGIYNYTRANTNVDIRVENTLFDNNISGNLNTGIRGLSGAASWFRVIGSNSDVNLKLINNTYVNNICDSDGNSISDANRATVVINKSAGTLNTEVVNCIFWNNYRPNFPSTVAMSSFSDTYQTAPNSIAVKNSIDQLNFNDASITSTMATSNANPLFNNINNDFTLQSGSPAIDTGDNTDVTTAGDLAGNVRVHNGTVDMGVYEFVASTLGIDDFNFDKKEIKLYPNPTTTVLNIKMEGNLKRATIYAVLGTKVFETQSNSINTSHLKTGMYVITIENETGSVITKRFIKQ